MCFRYAPRLIFSWEAHRNPMFATRTLHSIYFRFVLSPFVRVHWLCYWFCFFHSESAETSDMIVETSPHIIPGTCNNFTHIASEEALNIISRINLVLRWIVRADRFPTPNQIIAHQLKCDCALKSALFIMASAYFRRDSQNCVHEYVSFTHTIFRSEMGDFFYKCPR